MSILKQVTFDNARRRKDKTFSFTFTTDLEQNKEDINTIFENVDNAGVLYFKSNGVLTDEGNKEKEFTDFYSDKLEEVIQHFKDKLDND